MEYDIDEIVSNLDFKSLELVSLGNGLSLTNYELEVLNRYNIDYNNCSSLKEILYLIEDVFSCDDIADYEELDSVSSSFGERDYYHNTNK